MNHDPDLSPGNQTQYRQPGVRAPVPGRGGRSGPGRIPAGKLKTAHKKSITINGANPLWAALQSSLREDDARAGQDLTHLEALVRGGPLEAALGPLRGPIEAYNYQLALERLPAFLVVTARPGAAGTSAGIPPR